MQCCNCGAMVGPGCCLAQEYGDNGLCHLCHAARAPLPAAVSMQEALTPCHKPRMNRGWKNYLDDFFVRAGRYLGGRCLRDCEHELEIRSAPRQATSGRPLAESLEAAGFTPTVPLFEDGAHDSEGVALAKGKGKGSSASTDGDGPSTNESFLANAVLTLAPPRPSSWNNPPRPVQLEAAASAGSARLHGFLEIETREAVLLEVFHDEIRSCRAIRRWIVFSGCVLAYEAAQLGLVRTVLRSNEMVDWAVQWHRQACRLRSINRVRLRSVVDSSSEDTDDSL